jgi:hypothetical protein
LSLLKSIVPYPGTTTWPGTSFTTLKYFFHICFQIIRWQPLKEVLCRCKHERFLFCR